MIRSDTDPTVTAITLALLAVIVAAQAVVLGCVIALGLDVLAPDVDPPGYGTCLVLTIAGWALGLFRSPVEIKVTHRP